MSSDPQSSKTVNSNSARPGSLHSLNLDAHSNVLELLQPGSFVVIENQPNDLPPFQVLHCQGGRCWVRQQAWGQNIQWEVAHHRLKSA